VHENKPGHNVGFFFSSIGSFVIPVDLETRRGIKHVGLSQKTVDELLKAPPPAKNVKHADGAIKGFGIVVCPSGQASWIFRYYFDGKPKQVTIGDARAVPYALAAKRALEWKLALFEGRDPMVEKKRGRVGSTVAQVAELYIKKGLPKADAKGYIARLKTYILPEFGSMDIAAIKPDHVRAWFKNFTGIKKKKNAATGKLEAVVPTTQANRTLTVLKSMFRFAVEESILPTNHPMPFAGTKPHKERKRKRVLSKDEAPRLIDAVEAYPNVYIRNAIKFMALTSLRRGTVLRLRWDQVDFEGKRIIERNPKGDHGGTAIHIIPDAAIDVLKQTPRRGEGPFVFAGDGRTGHLVEIKNAWDKIKRNAGIFETEGFKLWVHDLRRTFASRMVTNKAPTAMIMQALNHKSLEAAEHYHVVDEDALRAEMNRVAESLLK
jgi:integrase